MANRRFQQYFFSLQHNPVYLTGTALIGTSGAVTTTVGAGITSVTRIAAGTYKVVLDDPYNLYLNGYVGFREGANSSTVASNSMSASTLYIIVSVGTVTQADWQSAGLPIGVVPAPGVAFIATGGTTGTSGTVGTPVQTGLTCTEIVGSPSASTNNSGPQASNYLIFRTLGATNSTTTTLIPTDPAAGTTLGLNLFFRNSSATSGA